MTEFHRHSSVPGAESPTTSLSDLGPAPPPPPLPPLPPPPLVRVRLSEPTTVRRSIYLEKLECMPDDYLSQKPEPPPYIFQPAYYFFYGSLTKPNMLKHILDLEEEPVLRPAKIYGYELSEWGQYPALIDGKPGRVVAGFAYLVQAVEHEYKLARYETSAYKLAGCLIHFTDRLGKHEDNQKDGDGKGGEVDEGVCKGEEDKAVDDDEDDGSVFGMTFMYAGDSQSLKEKRFDRTLWEMQMGIRLPPEWRQGGGASC